MFFDFGRMLNSHSLTLELISSCKLCKTCTWVCVDLSYICEHHLSEAKGHQGSGADKFVVQFNSDLCSPRSQMVLVFKNLIQRCHGFSFHLHIFILTNVGKIQSCQILPVGNGLSGIAVTIWWNRLLGGLKSAGTTFSWSPGDQRADIQLAPSSEQRTLLESTLLDILLSTACACLKCVNNTKLGVATANERA